MATKQQFLDGIAVISTSLTGIGESATNIEKDVNDLLKKITEGGLSAVEEQEILDVLTAVGESSKAIATQAKTISDIVPDPVIEPPVEPAKKK